MNEELWWRGGDLAMIVNDQLPARIADAGLAIDVKSDAFRIIGKAEFRTKDGRVFVCDLELDTANPSLGACKIPDAFLAHLCVSV